MFRNSVLVMRVCSAEGVGLFVTLAVLYPFVTFEYTAITVIMIDIYAMLCGISFEGFFCFDSLM